MYYNTDRRGYEPCTLLLDTRTIVENCAGYQKMDLAQSREGIDEPFSNACSTNLCPFTASPRNGTNKSPG